MGGNTSVGGPRLVDRVLAVPAGFTGAERRRARTLLERIDDFFFTDEIDEADESEGQLPLAAGEEAPDGQN